MRLVAEKTGADEWTSSGRGEFLASLQARDVPATLADEPEGSVHLRSAARVFADCRPGVILLGSGLVGVPDAGGIFRTLWNLSVLSGARVIPLAAENNERGSFELRRGLAGEPVSAGPDWTGKKVLYFAGDSPLPQGKPAQFCVFQGSFWSDGARSADVVLPAAVFAETRGTFVNLEGRILRSLEALPPAGQARPDWWITAELARRLGSRAFDYRGPDDIAREVAAVVPGLAEAVRPPKNDRPVFVAENPDQVRRLLPVAAEPVQPGKAGIVAGPAQDSYRGLNLAREVKGLKKLRERTEGRHV
jgi:hypothetical protein